MDERTLLKNSLKLLYSYPIRTITCAAVPWFTKIKSDKTIFSMIMKHLSKGFKNPHRTVWIPFVYPIEILYAMNLLPYMTEIYGNGFARFPTFFKDAFERALHFGIPVDACSFHHASVGIFTQGVMPKPRLVLGGTPTGCEDQYHTLRLLAKNFKTKFYSIDYPRNYEGEKEKLDYFKAELYGLIDFVEKETGFECDKESLKVINQRYRDIYTKYEKFMRLKAEIPTTLYESHFTAFTFTLAEFTGDIDKTERYIEEGMQDIEDHKITYENEKPIRLAWLGHPIIPLRKLQYYLAEKRAFIGYQEFMESCVPPVKTNSDPVEEIAEKYLSAYTNVPLGKRIEIIKKRLSEHKYDGIVYMTSWGCHQINSTATYILEELKNDYPIVQIDSDCCNPKNVGEQQLKMRLQALIEIIEQ